MTRPNERQRTKCTHRTAQKTSNTHHTYAYKSVSYKKQETKKHSGIKINTYKTVTWTLFLKYFGVWALALLCVWQTTKEMETTL